MSAWLTALLSTAAVKATAAGAAVAIGVTGAAAATGNLPSEFPGQGDPQVEVAEVAELENELDNELDGERPTDTHGYEVSEFAKKTPLEGCEKGQAIAAVAQGDEEEPRECVSGTDRAAEARERGEQRRQSDDNDVDIADNAGSDQSGQSGRATARDAADDEGDRGLDRVDDAPENGRTDGEDARPNDAGDPEGGQQVGEDAADERRPNDVPRDGDVDDEE